MATLAQSCTLALFPLFAALSACSGSDFPSQHASGGDSANPGNGGASAAANGGAVTGVGGFTNAAGGVASGSGGANGSGGAGSGGATIQSGGRAAAGAGGKSSVGGSGGKSGGGGSAAGGASAGGATSSGGSTAGGATSSGGSTAGNTSTAGATGSAGASSTWAAGNPNAACRSSLPARAQAVDTSTPTSVVGTGTAASCTFAQLQTAVSQGGVVSFNCGSAPVRITISATLKPPTNKNTVIDGGRKITLDGNKSVQIINFTSPDFRANDHGLTLQHIALVNGKSTPSEAIPVADPPCSQGFNDGEGGAIYMRDGYLTVIDSIFSGNQAAPLGPDTGGGAIYVLGSKAGVVIANSTFSDNAASNAGAVGGLFAELQIYNSLFSNNTALGHDANNDDASQCDAINNGQHEIGSGGNGGAIYSDGNSVNVTLCGDAITNNAAGTKAFGGGLFFTSNDMGGTLTIADTVMSGNTGGHWTNVASGSVKNVGSAVGTNCKSITLTNSTLQGL